ncbi:2,3-diaminopropionate biosynthesis protein SbnB [Paenibacillus radicis (ex Gao et al. 2016)]|uniref:2,3-diaminopropionate biosynthesis protein SbnB n=1 Tax=Paenibacillus radicis (ex Gao et al. 2016) TaxID=1737354 RepID=A0A917LXS3_9BACL|nr:2,3-diaminopropionate biosynthesis protein SbnB [Paenibacillus radicis (ex Gao et al. 2016)]GGG62800.1 2,3-diaminopropionate biosynthesis protein SbnB [Paenibacillus radicis (ex Gao et al. 2016)]
MRYLNEADIRRIGIDWKKLTAVIKEAADAYAKGEYAQPLKPYLKFGDASNRIIAMPAYVGKPQRAAGLKWIASYPGNIAAGMPRAHSVTVLNDPDTGEPTALIRGGLISAIRTAAVSGAVLSALLSSRSRLAGSRPMEAAIIGMGPIGLTHAQMLNALFSDREITRLRLYDRRDVDLKLWEDDSLSTIQVERVSSWQEAYRESDLILTCTASPERYIDEAPSKTSSILMHVSLRDYVSKALAGAGAVIVDDWLEVCRADTDIERLHLEQGLQAGDTVALAEALAQPDAVLTVAGERPVLFAPMGMAIFDVAVAAYYVAEAEQLGIGRLLD